MDEFNPQEDYKLRNPIVKYISTVGIMATLCAGTVLASGDGRDEPGFVPPPEYVRIPAPPRTISSGENTDPCCCCPVTPVARTEAKKPPVPPTLITKLKAY